MPGSKDDAHEAGSPGGGEADTQTHRIMRRGIAYGAPYDPGAPTGSAQAGDVEFPDDRGLLFLCYQHSLENQFRVPPEVLGQQP